MVAMTPNHEQFRGGRCFDQEVRHRSVDNSDVHDDLGERCSVFGDGFGQLGLSGLPHPVDLVGIQLDVTGSKRQVGPLPGVNCREGCRSKCRFGESDIQCEPSLT